jgi:hypothetical protein
MSLPRRQIVRSAPTPTSDPDRLRRLQRLRNRLEQERAAFTRWMPRLKRAFNAVAKSQLKIVRLERQITQMED